MKLHKNQDALTKILAAAVIDLCTVQERIRKQLEPLGQVILKARTPHTRLRAIRAMMAEYDRLWARETQKAKR